jgi:predicted TIM-barrel fold metal-dependent hydrolase
MTRRLLRLKIAVTLGAAAPLGAQTPIDSALYQYIKKIPAIDNPAHPVSTAPDDRDFDALPLEGLPPFAFPVRLRSDNPELLAAWKDIYGYPYDDRSAEHEAQVKQLKSKAASEKGQGYPTWVLDRLNIEVQLANRMALGPGLAPPRFRWVSFVDPLLFPLSTRGLQTNPDRADLYPREERHLKRYLKDLGLDRLPPTLDGYLTKVLTPTLEKMKRDGAVAVKYEAAYLRSIDFGPATKAQAARVYQRYLVGGAPAMDIYQPLQDYLFRAIGIESGRLGLAVHIHSADGAGGYYLPSGSDPLLLESAFSDPELRKTNFVIVHGGWPHTRSTMSLFSRPNVYADFSFLGNLLSASTLGTVLREWLSAYPERILFGSDAYKDSEVVGWEEWGWLGSTAGRKAVTIALTGMMRDGEIDRGRAEEIARMVFRENAAKLYHLEPAAGGR